MEPTDEGDPERMSNTEKDDAERLLIQAPSDGMLPAAVPADARPAEGVSPAAWIGAIFQHFNRRFATSVVPIFFQAEGGNPGLAGTGTLLTIADEHFLVTADHVLKDHSVGYYITDAVQRAPQVPLGGPLASASQPQFDVAAWKLDRRIVERLPNRTFITLSDVDFSRSRLADGWFLLHGFPQEWKRFDPRASMMNCETITHACRTYRGNAALKNHDPVIHVVLDIDQDFSTDLEGSKPRSRGSLKGVSGSTIWQFHRDGEVLAPGDTPIVKAVGIETSVHGSRGDLVMGTRWAAVLVLIRKQFPRLRDAIQVHLNARDAKLFRG